MRLWIKYDFASFKSSWNLSRVPFVFWQYRSEVTVQKRGFVFILAGFQSLLYFCTLQSIILYPLFFRPSFISRALLFSRSLSVSPSYVVTCPFFFFFFFCFFLPVSSFTVTVLLDLKHVNSSHFPLELALQLLITCLSKTTLLKMHWHLLHVSSAVPPPSSHPLFHHPSFTPQAWRSFLCSWHLFCWVINWDEHVGWRPMEEKLRPPPGNVLVFVDMTMKVCKCVYVCACWKWSYNYPRCG